MATSKASPAVSGTANVTLLLPGPTVNAVSPNPFPATGPFTITVTGSGFQSGVSAIATIGTTLYRFTTVSVTPTSFTATGGPLPSTYAFFMVRNPDSTWCNALRVAVGTSTPSGYSLSVLNGSGSGTYAAGQVVKINAGPPPAGQVFYAWTGANVNDPSAASTTLVMPSANVTVTAGFISQVSSIPYPVSSHPRLWVTPDDLSRLRSWATTSNPVYQQGMLPLLNQAVSAYKTKFFPGGSPNPNYPDPGDSNGYFGDYTELYATILAFNSLIDPNPAARILYAQYARNLLMYAMNQASLGHLAGAPFRDPSFATYCRANTYGEQWPLIVDWIYNATDADARPILTATDKAAIRDVFLMWARDCINAATSGGDHPSPIGIINSPQLLPNNKAYRPASNNFYLGHARLLTMMSLSIDPEDDPPVNPAVSPTLLGNTLRSYIPNATGAWLYQEYAMLGDPSTVAGAYGLPGNGAGLGLASGGLPPEGMLYGHSYASILGQLLALQTAGFNSITHSGPQIQLIGAPVWDRFVTGLISSLTPTSSVFESEKWLGPIYQWAEYGDTLRTWVTPQFMQPFALLALLEQKNSRTDHLNAARWFAVNVIEGGPDALMKRIYSPWSYGSTSSILYFLLLDPTAPKASDPRPSFPTLFFDQPAGRVIAHSNWGTDSTMFNYRASWISLDHQLGDAGQFEFFRNGEWLTREMSTYDANRTLGMTTTCHNGLALQNWSPVGTPSLLWYETEIWPNGGQWMQGLAAGDPSTIAGNGPGYVYVSSDLANLYNRRINVWVPNDTARDVTQATRSVLWINNDHIVIYDRATTLHDGLFKRFNLNMINHPVISGNVATQALDSGQQLFVQTLLPEDASITAREIPHELVMAAELEPTRYVLTVEDATLPKDVRFLHVLQGADPAASMVPATLVRSTGGIAFDGASFDTVAVYFPVNAIGTFTGTTLAAPTGVDTLLVTGLTAGASYSISSQPFDGGNIVSILLGTTGVLCVTADAAGVLRVSGF